MKQKIISIIGIGPRGLSALENLIIHCYKSANQIPFKIRLFEPHPHPGAGWVYDPMQISSNHMNIPIRSIQLPKREAIDHEHIQVSEFPSFQLWYKNVHPDIDDNYYPSRKEVGEYLHKRFTTLMQQLIHKVDIDILKVAAFDISIAGDQIVITDSNKHAHYSDEVLITIGHQSTKMAEYMLKWSKFVYDKQTLQIFTRPYPISQYESIRFNTPITIALRGFGLSMLDVIFGIEELADKQSKVHSANYNISIRYVPFDLDSFVFAPKPVNAKENARYQPEPQDLERLKVVLSEIKKSPSAYKNAEFLIEAIAPVAARVYLNMIHKEDDAEKLKEISSHIISWLQDQSYNYNDLFVSSEDPESTLESFLKMASGETNPLLDYVTGQVWHHCQDIIHEMLSYSQLPSETIKSIIDLEESMKRFTYGPSAKSVARLLKLIKNGKVNLDFLNDPEVKIHEDGWQLKLHGKTCSAKIYINTVLDSPAAKQVSLPMINTIRQLPGVQLVEESLGFKTRKDGILKTEGINQSLPIALTGRLSIGTVIGVDSINDAFGPASQRWAEGLLKRQLEGTHT